MDFTSQMGNITRGQEKEHAVECDMDYRRITYSLNIGLSMKRPTILQWSRELNTLQQNTSKLPKHQFDPFTGFSEKYSKYRQHKTEKFGNTEK